MADENEAYANELSSAIEDTDRAKLDAFVASLKDRYQQKAQERQLNKAPIRPADEDFLDLDSSVEKGQAFVNRLKVFTAKELSSLLQDMTTLNLTKHISEVSAALVVANLKMTDIDAALKLCTHLHRNYSNFASTLFESWQQALRIIPGAPKLTSPSKMRVDLCFYAELISVGILTKRTGMPLLRACLLGLIMQDKRKRVYLSVLLTFVKRCGTEFAGLVPIRISELAKKYGVAVPVSPLLTPNRQYGLRNLLYGYYQTLSKHLKSEHSRKCKNMAKKREWQISYETLHASACALAVMFWVDMPLLEKPIESASGRVLQNYLLLDPWRNEETRSFYVDLPHLNQYLPDDNEHKRQHGANVGNETPNFLENSVCFERFILNLSNCVNREMIDNAAVDFLLNRNTKSQQKLLARALFGVQHASRDLLPMFARFVTIVNSNSPYVGHRLCQMLKKGFLYHLGQKDPIDLEARIQLIQYVGELVKFGVFKKEDALYCLQHLLADFQHHNVEMACALLEVCGVYLYNSHRTRMQLGAFLEQMMRLKQNTKMSDRNVQLVENVYYLVKQPERLKVSQKKRSIIHSYIQHLIFKELNRSNVDQIVRRMRRLNWADEETVAYTVQCLSQAYNVRYNVIHSLADVLYVLTCYQEQAVERVIDTVLEDIRAGMEINDTNLARRQVSMVKYLGELYAYQLVESDTILNTLYSLISFGVNLPEHDTMFPSMLDPPGSLLRLKLALALLNTSGKYFYVGTDRDSLDHFLVFFQRYYWYKKSHSYPGDDSLTIAHKDLNPILTDHVYYECLASLRPNLKLYNSFEEANKAVDELRQKFLIESGELRYLNQAVRLSNESKQENLAAHDKGREGSVKLLLESTPSQHQDLEDHAFELEFERVLAESSHQQKSTIQNSIHVPEPTLEYSNLATQHNKNKKANFVPFAVLVRGKDKQQQSKMCKVPVDNPLAQYIHEQKRAKQFTQF